MSLIFRQEILLGLREYITNLEVGKLYVISISKDNTKEGNENV